MILKSYSKSGIHSIKEVASDHSGDEAKSPINVNSMVARTPSPGGNNTSKDGDLVALRNKKNEVEAVEATQGQHRFKRISHLAESVFGDTIVQQPSSSPTSLSRKDSTASVGCFLK